MSLTDEMTQQRLEMVERQLRRRDISDERVLEAMTAVPREAFIPEDLRGYAYDDGPLPIGEGQTISQPYIVALMTQALRLGADARVLEIGTGCGYAAAVLGHVAGEVFTIERFESLADEARRVLSDLGIDNVHVHGGDGSLGWPQEAPFDGIVATAAGPDIPRAFKEQLAIGGRIVMPVGPEWGNQDLVAVTRTGEDAFDEESLCGVRFVPLVGAQGWAGDKPKPKLMRFW